MIVTRYHKTFDGSFHFSVFIPSKDAVLGAFFRFSDPFTHYAIKFVPSDKKIYVYLVSPFGFKIIFKTDTDLLNAEVWLRVVIKFVRFRFKLHFKAEMQIVPDELNKDERDAELEQEG